MMSEEQMKHTLEAQQASFMALLTEMQRNWGPASREKKRKQIEQRITEFVYDPEGGVNFEAWFRKYEGLFEEEGAELDDKTKVEIILLKLAQREHKRTDYRMRINNVTASAVDAEVVACTNAGYYHAEEEKEDEEEEEEDERVQEEQEENEEENGRQKEKEEVVVEEEQGADLVVGAVENASIEEDDSENSGHYRTVQYSIAEPKRQKFVPELESIKEVSEEEEKEDEEGEEEEEEEEEEKEEKKEEEEEIKGNYDDDDDVDSINETELDKKQTMQDRPHDSVAVARRPPRWRHVGMSSRKFTNTSLSLFVRP
nr:unnamed protein product [Spirometra erinaceieuropaei]